MWFVGLAFLLSLAQANRMAEEKRELIQQTVVQGYIGPYMNLELRLRGGSNREGRLEAVMNGMTYSICDDAFDDIDAHVACVQLGFDSGRKGIRLKYGYGERRVLLDDLQCTGYETALENCASSGMGVHNCDGSLEGATVVCSGTQRSAAVPAPAPQPPPPPPPPQQRPTYYVQGVRLSHSSEGRVEVLVNNEYKAVCSSGWDDNAATVVCRMLNYAHGEAVYNTIDRYGYGSYEAWMDSVTCRGTERSLGDCRHSGFGVHRCDGRTQSAGVICRTTAAPQRIAPPAPQYSSPQYSTTVSVILRDGRSDYDGAVMCWHGNDYYPVCADTFRTTEASVVCRQLFGARFLGRTTTAVASRTQTGPTFLKLSCRGGESRVSDCTYEYASTSLERCYYGDASIECYQP